MEWSLFKGIFQKYSSYSDVDHLCPQALAAVPQLFAFLQRFISQRGVPTKGSAAPPMTAALTGCLQSLQATSRSARPKSAQGVLEALRYEVCCLVAQRFASHHPFLRMKSALHAPCRRRGPQTSHAFEDNHQHDVCEAVTAILDATAEELRSSFTSADGIELQTPSLRHLDAFCRQEPFIGIVQLPSQHSCRLVPCSPSLSGEMHVDV